MLNVVRFAGSPADFIVSYSSGSLGTIIYPLLFDHTISSKFMSICSYVQTLLFVLVLVLK